MAKPSRREILKGAGGCAGLLLQAGRTSLLTVHALPEEIQQREIQISRVSDYTIRISVLPLKDGRPVGIPSNGTLAQESWGPPVATLSPDFSVQTLRSGNLSITALPNPLSFQIHSSKGKSIQQFIVDPAAGTVSFDTGDAPLLGLGEGGPQFDRRNSTDSMVPGQSGYKLATNGGRVPIPWIVGSSGWAILFHQPFGTFDFTGAQSVFRAEPTSLLPLDYFFVAADDPATILSEYARLTGLPQMLPRWALGYQQSHRTLASREEVLQEGKTFREKKLPCDALIYLGTGFCPSGWNTANGSFAWNTSIFSDPQQMIDQLHADHFRVVLHAVILTDRLQGSVTDPCDVHRYDEQQVGCYWDAHRKDFSLGIDGWWPDEGDPLDVSSHVARHMMYWEGPQLDRPNVRPFTLHRNGFAGMQRFGSVLWSGDVDSRWKTLQTHIPVSINTGLTGIPYWGTDIGGFVPTDELTAELYVRWFQFGAFCPLFRSHGRTWKLRLPWGWNTGNPGPVEVGGYRQGATPDASQLHNPQVEIICRKYLELRYRLLPYLYSLMYESTTTGIPLMRSLWLHFPDDPQAVISGDVFLLGKSLLVAPVVEKTATTRRFYLPRGDWFDFWTGEKIKGGREVSRAVDLETMPLYVRGGSILPLGPVKQYTDEPVDSPITLQVYPGADASFLLYDDDGNSFNFRHGEWTGIQIDWNDELRTLHLQLAPGSKFLGPAKLNFEVRLEAATRPVIFDGSPVRVKL
jgi:alpha-glucosidase/alpha-D-xyloside xylohydrolase